LSFQWMWIISKRRYI